MLQQSIFSVFQPRTPLDAVLPKSLAVQACRNIWKELIANLSE
jgi:hypothetical protein